MQTDTNVGTLLKAERRKVFHAMHTLPWLLLAIVLAVIGYHFYREANLPLNVTSMSAPSLPLNITEVITTNVVEVVETIPKGFTLEPVQTVHDFKVEAVSNKHAEWIVNINGETAFKWLEPITNDIPKPKTIHGISRFDREFPFTLANLDAAAEINLDIEEEIMRIILVNLESEFIGRNSKEDIELKKKLQKNIIESIKKIFDGWETFNKENARR